MGKKILITGANSYIGVNVKEYLLSFKGQYIVDELDVKGDSWKTVDFSTYDVIFHVAGIAHIKETKENTHLYYEVNEKLAIETAEKAKVDGVKQFIILSTMSVYGLTTGHITKDTKPSPINSYGRAKLNADIRIKEMETSTFKVAILRPPMVYGKGCKGNYQMLRKFALKFPFFPNYKNERSMLYVGNLAAFLKELIDNEKSGLFFPQDAEYVCTTDMVSVISKMNGKSTKKVIFLNWVISIALGLRIGVFKKVFGSLTYEKVDLVTENSFEEAMEITEE